MCNEVELTGKSKFCDDCRKQRNELYQKEYNRKDQKCRNCGGERELGKTYCDDCRKEKELISKRDWNNRNKKPKNPKQPSERSIILQKRTEINERKSIIEQQKLVYKERLRVYIMNIELKGSLGLDDLNELLELW